MISDGEAGAVAVSEIKLTILVAEERVELAGNLIANIADAERFHFKETVFEAGDFREVIDLVNGALGNTDKLRLNA